MQRAIEVYLQTGVSITTRKQEHPIPHESTHRLRILALDPPRKELYDRINKRTEEHFNAGLVNEVENLLKQGIRADSNALGAHGYRRVVEFLQGRRELPGAVEQTKLDIRHYAKRQLTWFRHEPDVEWFSTFGEQCETIEAVLAALEAGPSRK